MEEYFDLSNSPHREYLESKTNLWEAVGDLDSYIEQLFLNPPHGFTQKNNLLVGPDLDLDPNAKIVGRAVIGKGTTVKDGALLRNGVIIGENCTIGHASEVKHSLILNKTNVAHLNYVGDSLIGSKVNLAAGVVLANFKNGSKNPEVFVEIQGQKINTGMQKLGAIVGDNSKIGSNVVTDPGTIIGKNTLIYPLAPIRGTVSSNKIVKFKPPLEIVEKE